nr:TonB-dependent hemoglobin/transferrin/lactoferrin family receptor [uncultured Rhodoferax sp.]
MVSRQLGQTGNLGTLTQIAMLVALACAGAAAWAQESSGTLKTVVISASRVEQDVEELPATMTVISAADVDQKMATDLEDLMQDEVGVSVRALPHRATTAAQNSTGRMGNEGINIRGLEGDQVRLQVDGVSLPSSYTFGPIAIGRGDSIDPEGYKQVEILRGAASTQYGSDGLAGSVSFVTKDPEDLIPAGKTQQFTLKSGYSSADNAMQVAPSFAFKGDALQGLIVSSMRRGEETSNMGSNSGTGSTRTAANPQSNRSDYVLGKLKYKVSADHAVKLTMESMQKETNTEELSQLTTTLRNEQSRDAVKRNMLKLDYQYTPLNSWFDVLDVGIYGQTSETAQLSWQNVVPTVSAPYSYRTRNNWYDENSTGIAVQLESNWGDATKHRLIYGADARWAQMSMLSNAYQNAGTYTARAQYFPDTDARNMGVFVQDEIKMGKLTLTPGLRYDSYSLTPNIGPLNSSAVKYGNLSDGGASPKLGATWAIQPALTLFSQYSHGFRAPKADQVNGGFTGSAQGFTYQYLGNPNLKSESSDSVELGVRGKGANYKYSAAAFYGKYKDFISQTSTASGGVTYYQYVNLNQVTLSGIELRGEWTVSPSVRLSAAYAHTEGVQNNGSKDTYLATVDPDKLVAGLHYAPRTQWGLTSQLTLVERNLHAPTTSGVVPGGYGVLDLTGWYQFSKATKLNAGLYNVFDKKYIQWADIRDLSVANASQADAYTATGRNVKISVIHNF